MAVSITLQLMVISERGCCTLFQDHTDSFINNSIAFLIYFFITIIIIVVIMILLLHLLLNGYCGLKSQFSLSLSDPPPAWDVTILLCRCPLRSWTTLRGKQLWSKKHICVTPCYGFMVKEHTGTLDEGLCWWEEQCLFYDYFLKLFVSTLSWETMPLLIPLF